MAKKIAEMTAAGSGATIGPIQPLGQNDHVVNPWEDTDKVKEMLERNPDLKPLHVVVFAREADFFTREDFNHAAMVEDYGDMANMVREAVARVAVRSRMNEVVRKNKDGKYVLYAPNTGKKHSPKPVAIFSTKLAAKRAELAKFPPKDPKKLERLKKQIEKLLKDPKARAKEITMREKVDRDLFETALLSMILEKDATRVLLREDFDFEEPTPSGDEYTKFVKRFSKRALANDPEYQDEQGNYKAAATKALSKKAVTISQELGLPLQPLGEPKKHRDGKIYMPCVLKADCEVKPIFLYADGDKVKVRLGKDAKAALTQCQPEVADKIRSRLGNLNEEEAPADPDLAPAYGKMVDSVKRIRQFLDEFLTKLSPRAMTMLKDLLAKKFRKLGAKS